MSKEQGARELITILQDHGYQAWLVGGCVRDRLLGRIPKDYDLATTSHPQHNIECLTESGYRVYSTGLDYGTVTVVVGEYSYELTTLRRDVSCDGRKAQVVFGGTLQSDAARRDFTINALYEDLHGEIYDYVGGQADLSQRLMRFVGDPQRRIREDYLRILRFFRLAQRLGFELDSVAVRAIASQAHGIASLAKERVYNELVGMFDHLSCSECPGAAWLDFMEHRCQIWQVMLRCNVWQACGWYGLPAEQPYSTEHIVAEYFWFGGGLRMPAAMMPLKVGLMMALFRVLNGELSRGEMAVAAGAWHRTYKSSVLHRRSFELWWQLMSQWRQWLGADDYPAGFFNWLNQAQHLHRLGWAAQPAVPESADLVATTWGYWVKELLVVVRAFQVRFSCGGTSGEPGGNSAGAPNSSAAAGAAALSGFQRALVGLEYVLYLEDQWGELRLKQLMSAQQIMQAFDLSPGKLLGHLLKDLQQMVWQEQVIERNQAQEFIRQWLCTHGDDAQD